MTTYHLPEGMSAGWLREHADWLTASDDQDSTLDIADDLRAWADAIDPPKPPSVITDEMVQAVRDEAASVVASAATKRLLEAAVKCGWTPPQELSQEGGPTASSSEAVAPGSQAGGEAGVPQGPCPESESLSPPPPSLAVGGADDYWRRRYVDVVDEWDEALNRLSMAEGLLRRVTIEAKTWETTAGIPVNGGGWWVGSKDWPDESHKVNVTPDEAEYLRSLDGEGGSDE